MALALYRKNGGPEQPLPQYEYTADGYAISGFADDPALLAELGYVFSRFVEDSYPGEQAPVNPGSPKRLEIPKSIIMARLNEIGKFEDMYAALTDPGTPKIYFSRWFSPDWPNVFFDDNDMILFFMAIGMTELEIEEVTVPYVPPPTGP